MDNGRHLASINSDQQLFLVHEQPHQPHNAAQTSRINICTSQTTILPFSSGLNYVELNISNLTSFYRFPLDDQPNQTHPTQIHN